MGLAFNFNHLGGCPSFSPNIFKIILIIILIMTNLVDEHPASRFGLQRSKI